MNGTQGTFEYWPILVAFSIKGTHSHFQKNQKSKNMTMISFKGHNGMAKNQMVKLEQPHSNVASLPVAAKGYSLHNVISLTIG